MKFLLDESADFPLASFLKQGGHDVTSIAHDYPNALADEDVLAIAHKEQRILITNDKDFGELIIRRHLPHVGVVLFRLHYEDLATKVAWLGYVIDNHAESLSEYIVITSNGIRIRRTQDV